jgi:hypothetical protein
MDGYVSKEGFVMEVSSSVIGSLKLSGGNLSIGFSYPNRRKLLLEGLAVPPSQTYNPIIPTFAKTKLTKYCNAFFFFPT